jgi:hypothetical protein
MTLCCEQLTVCKLVALNCLEGLFQQSLGDTENLVERIFLFIFTKMQASTSCDT